MKLRCISNRLNYIIFEKGNPRRAREGDTFVVKAKEVPAKWAGLVVEDKPVRNSGPKPKKVAVTNPAEGAVQQEKPDDA